MATDNFTDSDGVALATHDAKWKSIDATYPVSNFEIQSNAAQAVAAWESGRAGAYYDDGQSDDQSSEIVDKARATTATIRKSIGCRLSASNRGYALSLSVITGTDFTRASLTKNGSWLAGGGTGTWNVYTDHTLKIKVAGAVTVTIEMWVDGAALPSASDSSSPITFGKPGFWHNGNSKNKLDTIFDDWTDGISSAILLDANAACSVSASGDLTTEIALNASAVCAVSAVADLTTEIIFSANAVCSASASGDLTTEITLNASANCTVSASGDLATEITLDASAICSVSAVADLTTEIIFSASAICSASATADLMTGVSIVRVEEVDVYFSIVNEIAVTFCQVKTISIYFTKTHSVKVGF